MKPRIVTTHRIHPDTLALLETAAEVISNQSDSTMSREEVLLRTNDADGMMVPPYPFTKRTGKSMKSTVYPDHPRASASFAYRHLLH